MWNWTAQRMRRQQVLQRAKQVVDKDRLTARAERVTDLPPDIRLRWALDTKTSSEITQIKARTTRGPQTLHFVSLSGDRKADDTNVLFCHRGPKQINTSFSALSWPEPFLSPALSPAAPSQRPLVTQEPHRQAESRGLGWGISFSKSQTAALALAAGMGKKPKEKRGASVCSSSSDAELGCLPGSVQLWERQMLCDWWVASPWENHGWHHPAKRESRFCHCSPAPPFLPSQKETTERFRTGVSGSWELHGLGQGSSHCSASRKAALGELAATALALDLRHRLEITGEQQRAGLHPQCSHPTMLSCLSPGAAPAPSPLWSLGAIKASFTKIPFTPAVFCHPSTIPGPVLEHLTMDNTTQGFPPKNPSFFSPTHP